MAADTSRGASATEIVAQLLSPAGRSDPYGLYADLHELGPAHPLGEEWVVCGYAEVNQVLRDPGFGIPESTPSRDLQPDRSALGSMGSSILRANPPAHGRMRSLMSRVFTPRRVADLAPAVEDAVDDLLEHLSDAAEPGGAVDFMAAFAFPLPITVICELLGVPDSDRARFRPLAADLTEALELPSGQGVSAAASAAAEELSGYFAELVDQRRRETSEDLISTLVAARDSEDGQLSDEELLANLIMLLVAGFETTTSLLGNGLSILLDQPWIAAALRSTEMSSKVSSRRFCGTTRPSSSPPASPGPTV